MKSYDYLEKLLQKYFHQKLHRLSGKYVLEVE